jgi:hypothetical protein
VEKYQRWTALSFQPVMKAHAASFDPGHFTSPQYVLLCIALPLPLGNRVLAAALELVLARHYE